MIQKIILTKRESKFTINNATPFKNLQIKSATSVEGTFNTDEAQYILLKLRNDTQVFNSRTNIIPNTNQFNCFDLLETAAQIPALWNVSFHTLEIEIPVHQYQREFTVTMEVEVE